MIRAYKKIYKIYGKLMIISPINHFKILKFKKRCNLKLNIGCGRIKFPGWVNIDLEPTADLIIDVNKGLPFRENTAGFIYNEHFIEHLEYVEGEKAIKEFYRVLKEGGILRIATPDLEYITRKYLGDWKTQDWISWPEYQYIKTRGQMINISFRNWGHKYLYNEEDLTNLLKKAGFRTVLKQDWNKSNYSELSGRETRKDSKLILEAVK
jgi:predicted SAM-dependent methyltransferase